MTTPTEKPRVAIIGGGISGLSTLHFLKRRLSDDVSICLFEADSRLGGTIGSDRFDGYVCDWGPNGFLDRVPLTLQLVEELGLQDKLRPANPQADNRFIYRPGRLHAISASPVKFMTSSLLSLRGRLRVTIEPLIKPKRDDTDESVFDFAARRIGREAAEAMIDPMVSGIFGGDAKAVSLRSCFPVMEEMERNYGSLFKAMLARKKSGKNAGPAGPSGRLTSFDNGLYTIIERFHELYCDQIQKGSPVERIIKTPQGYRVEFSGKPSETFSAVVLATPAFAAAQILRDADRQLSDVLNQIPYASLAVCCFGYSGDRRAQELDGFGFLVPRNEGKRILGSIWTSSIFQDQAPAGQVLLRSMAGGYTDPAAVQLTDDELISLVHGELTAILGLQTRPSFVRIFRYEKGIPQFTLGHSDRLKQIDQRLATLPGIYLASNAYSGIGLNDCVTRAHESAEKLSAFLQVCSPLS
ncbi:MAG: protoporphyrinogen oxidase [candidate division Zixibacteria bacterium]|nr:protoporphyrinogen oxidase [candidate division Zixibacteria bacterium]